MHFPLRHCLPGGLLSPENRGAKTIAGSVAGNFQLIPNCCPSLKSVTWFKRQNLKSKAAAAAIFLRGFCEVFWQFRESQVRGTAITQTPWLPVAFPPCHILCSFRFGILLESTTSSCNNFWRFFFYIPGCLLNCGPWIILLEIKLTYMSLFSPSGTLQIIMAL